MLKVIVFNAKYPRAGKDTAADHMANLINVEGSNLVAYRKAFKDKLMEATAKMLNISLPHFLLNYACKTEDVYEAKYMFGKLPEWWKDVPMHSLGGEYVSKRQALIYCSEELFKPLLGLEVFGQILADTLPEEGVVLVSDSGFSEELLPVIRKVGKENVTVCRIHREVKSPTKDSRSMLTPEMFDSSMCPQFVDIVNSGTEEEFLVKVENTLGDLI